MVNNYVQVPPDSNGKQIATNEISGKHYQIVNIAGSDGVIGEPCSNVSSKFRDNFEGTSLDSTKWTSTVASGDYVFIDGNTVGTSYAVISKSPLVAGNETNIETIPYFDMPLELSAGIHFSQNPVGQEFSYELVDTESPDPDVADVAIASISQTTTTITVNTSTSHGLVVGKAIGIRGAADNRVNFSQLVVATTPSPTQFTCTAGPGGTITSQTVSTTGGFVYFRERLGRAKNGMSAIFENTSSTNASFYIRASSGDSFPSGTVAGNHSSTVGSRASVQTVNAAYNYGFTPTTEYRLHLQSDKCSWLDSGVDSTSAPSQRGTRTQLVPDPSKNYKLRIRTKNQPSMPRPVARITSIVKTGTTTATVNTDVPHNLTTTSYVQIYGVRDQTNFPNLTAATVVASTPTSTSFTIVIGTASTNTSYGGFVSVSDGNALIANNGALAQTVQAVSTSSNVLTAIGSATWSGILIGDTVQMHGVNDIATGAPVMAGVSIDGAYKVRNINTTSLELEPIDGRTLADIGSTNCGGGVIRRSDMRISFVRIFDYERLRIESVLRGSGDSSSAIPVNVQNSLTVSSATLAAATNNFGYVGLQIPLTVADIASAAITSSSTTSAVTPAMGAAYQVNIPVTAVSGTNPTMDVTIEESDDSGTNWYKVYDFPRITVQGIYRSPPIFLKGNRIRYVQTIGGTSPSFTRSLNRLQYSAPADCIRQLVDRTISLTTLNSTTPILLTRECGNTMQLIINVGAITTTAPQLQLEGSDDYGATWYAIGTPLTAVASSTVQTTITPMNSGAVRARVSTAGVGVTAGYVMIKCHD